MWTTALWDHHASLLQWSVVIGASLSAAIIDVRTGRIPNALTGALGLAGLAQATVLAGTSGLLDSLAGGLMLLAPYMALFFLASGGAGDAKLMGAMGTWLGIVNGAAALVGVALCGIVIGLGAAFFRKRHHSVLVNIVQVLRLALYKAASRNWEGLSLAPVQKDMQPMPYGPAICAGACAAAVGVFLWRT